jgi:hypothetical protein
MDFQELAELVESGRTELSSLRNGVTIPLPSQGPQVFLSALLDVRGRLDRMEEVFRSLIRLKATVDNINSDLSFEADTAWAEALARASSKSSARITGEYHGPRERYAEADLAVLDLRKRQRDIAKRVAGFQAYLDEVRTAHRGLEGVRQDLLAALRSFQFESSLER